MAFKQKEISKIKQVILKNSFQKNLLILTLICGSLLGLVKIYDSINRFRFKTVMVWAPSEKKLNHWCVKTDQTVKKYGWDIGKCDPNVYQYWGESVKEHALVYWEFGNPKSDNKTLIFSMVHGDEITPFYIALKLVEWFESERKNIDQESDFHVILAPLVNPDGFYQPRPKRINARGVDLNRNFPTTEWSKNAVAIWKNKGRSNPRRFPGWRPNSEPETQFQVDLINKYDPKKLITIHSPLNHLDYDGPSAVTLDKFPKEYVERCLALKRSIKAVSAGYYAGSLGNYSGNERGIPTLTLELPSSNYRKAKQYWNSFKEGIHSVVHFQVPDFEDQLASNVKKQ